MPLDPEFPTESLRRSGYNVHLPGGPDSSTQASEIPDPQVRDAIFQEAGLLSYVKNWAHLERDILFLRAEKQSLKDLIAKYPNLPKRSLQALKKLVQQGGGGQ